MAEPLILDELTLYPVGDGSRYQLYKENHPTEYIFYNPSWSGPFMWLIWIPSQLGLGRLNPLDFATEETAANVLKWVVEPVIKKISPDLKAEVRMEKVGGPFSRTPKANIAVFYPEVKDSPIEEFNAGRIAVSTFRWGSLQTMNSFEAELKLAMREFGVRFKL